jgi:hypothetical protein
MDYIETCLQALRTQGIYLSCHLQQLIGRVENSRPEDLHFLFEVYDARAPEILNTKGYLVYGIHFLVCMVQIVRILENKVGADAFKIQFEKDEVERDVFETFSHVEYRQVKRRRTYENSAPLFFVYPN